MTRVESRRSCKQTLAAAPEKWWHSPHQRRYNACLRPAIRAAIANEIAEPIAPCQQGERHTSCPGQQVCKTTVLLCDGQSICDDKAAVRCTVNMFNPLTDGPFITRASYDDAPTQAWAH